MPRYGWGHSLPPAKGRKETIVVSPSSRATPSGVLFNAVGVTPAYLSRTDHRSVARGSRNKWKIIARDEYDVFCASHTNSWLCSKEHNWGLRPGLAEIGTNGECIAKFPRPSNPADERHGYPVSAGDRRRELEHRPPVPVTADWRARGLITDSQKARIDRGKV